MQKLLSPKLDIVFKQLFMKETDLLLDLINNVLQSSEQWRIQTVDVRNPFILAEELSAKYIVLDIKAVDNAGRIYNIEMQVKRYPFYAQRALFYLSRMYSSQLKSGDSYECLKPLIGIHFLAYELFPAHPELHYCFELRDGRYPELVLTSDISLHLFELPKQSRGVKSNHCADGMCQWLKFIDQGEKETHETMKTQYTNPAIFKAYEVLSGLSADEEMRIRAEIREKALRDELSALSAARAEGEAAGEARGESKGAILTSRSSILDLLEVRFGTVPKSIQTAVQRIEDKETLSQMLKQVVKVSSLEEFEGLLVALP